MIVPKCALVASADAGICADLSAQLHRRGIAADWSVDGGDAALRLRENDYDLALIDLNLEAISGELLLKLMDRGTLRRPGALALMSPPACLARIADADWSASATLLSKPFTSDDVSAFLDRAMGEKDDAPHPIVVAGTGLWSEALCRVLVRRGARCLDVPTAASLAEICAHESPAAVVIGPPIERGDLVHVAAQLRAASGRGGTAIIAALSAEDPDFAADLLTIGADRVLSIAGGLSRLSQETMRLAGLRRRIYRRVPFAGDVMLSGTRDILVGRAFDIGEGGIGVMSPRARPAAHRVALEFVLDGKNAVSATSEVAWIDESSPGSVRLGLRFRDVPEEVLSSIRDFVAHAGL